MLSLFLGFLLGAVAIVVAELWLLVYLLDRLSRKSKEPKASDSQAGCDLNAEESISFSFNKQGAIWVLDSVPKVLPKESSTKATKEQNSKKEIVEVFPVKKYAKIKDQLLILTDSSGSQAKIHLVGCVIVAVSASSLSSRKWAKKYPLKIENRKSVVYNGSNTCYIYLETSWEKESWCKALRLASCVDKERINWHVKLNAEFHNYVQALNVEYPSFMKPAAGLGEPTEREIRLDGSSSKVRVFLKKLAKKASKGGAECKTSTMSPTAREERKIIDKFRSAQDRYSPSASVKSSSSEKTANNALEEDDVVLPLPSTLDHSDSHGSVLSEADFDEKFGNDEGTLCWNLLFSRLFFDAKRSSEINSFLHIHIQRMLSNMRTPNYVGGITCTNLDIGNLPPYIHNIRVLPMDMNEVWAMEADIEYSGAAIMYIEMRLEVREPDFQKGLANTSMDEGAGEAAADLFEGIERYKDQLKLSRDSVNRMEKSDQGDKLDGLKTSKSTSWTSTYVSKWKSILNSLADQVSQVPLALAIRVTSFRGTIRLHIKPPPSDQIWFSFTAMPDIDLNLDSSVGEHKITNAHVATLIGSRFKAAIRETLVLPNCENICVPWMIGEKEDWVPRKDAPFIWAHQEASDSTGRDPPNCQPAEAKTKLNTNKGSKRGGPGDNLDDDHEKSKSVVCTKPPSAEPAPEPTSSSQPGPSMVVANDQSIRERSLEDLTIPLLQSNQTQESCGQSRPESPMSTLGAIAITGDEQVQPKRVGRRARMLDLGKKMGEKLEEKRRNIEEKSRTIVEKMRGHDI
ncbi:uncharacterized protein LOC131242861 [Magnolia sinica]|uniref:uncharacterized protein LOC131242861 n=1 Tax=Magnolia sinica TaxID=86752 RepID=UPI00265B6E71|nr:uncharacterized protein LOC131242861 [Magnolia sinica]